MRITALVITFGMLNVALGHATDSETFLDKFRYGIELVHRLFSSDAPSHFKTFFAGAFKDYSKSTDNFSGNLFDAIVRTIGNNQEEIGVAGMRMSVFLAKMISDAFYQAERTRKSAGEGFHPLEIILRQPQVRDMIRDVRDPKLTERVWRDLGSGNDTECVRLLICKLSPFVRGMQRSLNFFVGVDHDSRMELDTWAKSTPLERMYLFVPGLNEFLENGDVCDERHPLCVY